jgi:hypothetical protein
MKLSQKYYEWCLNTIKKEEYVGQAKEIGQKIELCVSKGQYEKAYNYFKETSEATQVAIPKEVEQLLKTFMSLDIIEEGYSEVQDFPEGTYNAILAMFANRKSRKMVVRIETPLNYLQTSAIAKKLNEDSYLCWIICPSVEMTGRIIADNDRFDNMNLAIHYQKTTEEGTKDLLWFFGESHSKYKGMKNLDTLSHRFHEYDFISDDGKRFLLFSDKELRQGKYTIKGILSKLTDYKKVGEKAQKMVTLEGFFMHTAIPFNYLMTKEKIDSVRKKYDSHDKLSEALFGKRRHPVWFEKLMFSTLFAIKDYSYPSHLLIIGKAGTGKTRGILNPLKIALDEQLSPISGNTSRIKGLIPSFKETPPDIGFLCKADRVALIDEFFTFIGNADQQSGPKMDKSNYFGMMKDILEHEEKSAVSGNGSTKVKMSAIAVAVTNPLEYHNLIDVNSVAEKVDRAFLSRFLIYQMNEQHESFVDENKQVVVEHGEEESYPALDYDFVALFDYLNNIRVKGLDIKKAITIFKKHLKNIPSNLIEVYRARYDHHLVNLVIGACKYRYVVGEKKELVVDDEDYKLAEEILGMIISSWDKHNIKDLPNKIKVNAVPIGAKTVYEIINTLDGKRVQVNDPYAISNLCDLNESEVNTWMAYLSEVGLLKVIRYDDTNYYAPFWFDEEKLKGGGK